MRINEIKSEMQFLSDFGSLAKILQEISMMKIESVRSYVVKARQYKDGLTGVYKIVKLAEKKLKNKKKLQTAAKSDKKVAVLLSANQRMFGSITQEVFEKFVEYIDSHDDEVVVVGKIGKNFYETYGIEKPYEYFDLKDMDITYIDLLPILSHVMQYGTITVFYGSYTSIFVQKAEAANVTGDELFADETPQTNAPPYRFEPSAEEMNSFFSGQIVGLLFRQSAYEFELSRHASRVQALEQALAQSNTKQRAKRLMLQKLKINENTKQQLQNVLYLTQHKNY
jgi:hypothetical protein